MGKKLDRVYAALIDGASDGLTDEDLFEHVRKECPKTSSKRVVRASLLALTDPKLKERDILNTIYALAIKYRLQDLGVDEDAHDDDDESGKAPLMAEPKKKKGEKEGSDTAASQG